MDDIVRVLIAADGAQDAKLVEDRLQGAGIPCSCRHVRSTSELILGMTELPPDVILSESSSVSINPMAAIAIARRLAPSVPVIVIVESPDQDIALDCIRVGATDCVAREDISRLSTAVRTAVEIGRILGDTDSENQALLNSPYRVFAESMPQAVMEAAADGTLTFINRTGLVMFGYTEDDLAKGLSCLDLVSLECRPMVQSRMRRVLGGESLPGADYLGVRKDGRTFPIAVSSSPVTQDGQVTGFRSISVDVSERQRAEEALHQAQDELGRLLEGLDAMMFRTTPDGRTLALAGCLERVSGFTIEEMLADPDLWRKRLHPDELVRIKESLDESAENRRPALLEFRLIAKDGHTVWIRAHVTPRYDYDDTLDAFEGIGLDVTERKLAEDRLRDSQRLFELFMDNLPAVAYIKDEDGRYDYLNSRLDSILNLEPGSGRRTTVRELWPKEVAEALLRNDAAVIAAGMPLEFLEDIPQPDGLHHFLSLKFPIESDSGRRLLGGVSVDITESTRTEEAWKESEERYRTLSDGMSEGFAYCKMLYDGDGHPVDWVYLNVNKAFERLTGLDNVVGKRVTEAVPGLKEANPEVFEIYGRVARTGRPEKFTVDVKPLGVWLDISVSSPGQDHFVALFDDITELKRAGDERETTIELLRLINSPNNRHEMIEAVVRLLQEWTGCDSVGIRLREGEDFPYFVTTGFSGEFVLAENHLCAVDEKGEMVRDSQGDPVIECMCGNVLCGRFDPTKPFFTDRGSFWTNCTTELLASTTEADRQGRTRNRCNGQGYESVALIPMRSGEQTIGLLQLNSRKPDRFTPEIITLLEGMANSLGIALAQRAAQEALRISEDQYRTLVNQAADGIFLADLDGKFLEVNGSCCGIFGYSAEEMQRMSIQDINLAEDSSVLDLHLTRLRSGETVLSEWDVLRRDGTVATVEVSAQKLGSDRLIGMARDITDRKRVEGALIKRLVYERMVSDISYLAAWDADLADYYDKCLEVMGKTLDVSRAFILEYDANSDMLHRTHEWAAPGITPQQRNWSGLPASTVPWWREWILSGRVFSCPRVDDIPSKFERELLQAQNVKSGLTIPVTNSNGQHVYLAFHECRAERDWPPEDIEILETVARIIAGVIDRKLSRHALEESEHRYRDVVENAQEGVWSIDSDSKTVFVNKQMAEMLGYTVEEMLGTSLFSYSDELGAARTMKNLQMRKEGFRGLLDAELIRKDGSRIHTSVQAWPVFGSNGDYEGAIAFVADNTERRQLEAQLRQSHKLEAIGTLAGGIAHDFKNILMGISAYTEVLQIRLGSDHSEFGITSEMLNCVDKASNLIGQLLTFSRRHSMDARPTEINSIVLESQQLLGRLVGEHIIVNLELSPEAGVVNADPGQIGQVLLNLVVNARDAMPKGGDLKIATRRLTFEDVSDTTYPWLEPGDYAELVVSDTGIGMDEETAERIFEPFFTTKNRSERSGLGLAVAYGIIKQHGGHISVDSEPDRGTTFRVYIPLIEAEVVVAIPSGQQLPVIGTETILLVEDEDTVREPMRAALEQYGYTVLGASNGEEAVELFKERRDDIDLAILDLVMPKMGGAQASVLIREMCPDIKVLLISGHSPESVGNDFAPPDDTPLMWKPFSLFHLAERIRELIDARPK